MLVLSRRLNEQIVLPGLGVTVQVLGIKHGSVRLGIDAPSEVRIVRKELQDRAAPRAQPVGAPATGSADDMPHRLNKLIQDRLALAHAGLVFLRRELKAGNPEDVAATLDRIEEEIVMLQQRLQAEAAKPSAPAVGPAAKPRSALLVEDNANEREVLATFLRTAGFDVATAGDGVDALDYLRTHNQPDAVLLDMGLPRCDGASVVHTLRHDPDFAGLRIFAVSGHLPQELGLDDGPEGVDRWFRKPIDPATLVHEVNEELEGSRCCANPTRAMTPR